MTPGVTLLTDGGLSYPKTLASLLSRMTPAPVNDSTPAPLAIQTIDCRTANASELVEALRQKLSLQGDIVSAAGRQRTIELFGSPLTPRQVVEQICRDVRTGGRSALLGWGHKLDRRELTPAEWRVSPEEFRAARAAADPAFLAMIERVAQNIRDFQSALLPADVRLQRTLPGGGEVILGQRYRPLRRVGICVPGGAAAYPSTLLMTAVPAQVAGVREIAVAVPPTPFGGYNASLLAACDLLGVTEVYRMGGAQGVAALAYGVEGLPRVDKIVGPGNLFVALAKQHVYGEVDIDSIAGPSEVVLIADDSADPRFVASDLISQAEHSPGSGLLLTWHAPLIAEVTRELSVQLAQLERGDLARVALEQYGGLILCREETEAVELADRFAPEHLHLSTREPWRLLERVQNAGAIFLGHHTPVAVGDYVAGPSHVLPTGGTARFANGLCSIDFLKRSSLISYDQQALQSAAADLRLLAATEGLTAHSASVDIRLPKAGR